MLVLLGPIEKELLVCLPAAPPCICFLFFWLLVERRMMPMSGKRWSQIEQAVLESHGGGVRGGVGGGMGTHEVGGHRTVILTVQNTF